MKRKNQGRVLNKKQKAANGKATDDQPDKHYAAENESGDEENHSDSKAESDSQRKTPSKLKRKISKNPKKDDADREEGSRSASDSEGESPRKARRGGRASKGHNEESEAEEAEGASPKKAKSKRKSGGKTGKNKSPEKEVEEAATDADEEQYEVEKVLDQKPINGVRNYLIRWKGYGEESDTWEPASTLNCSKLIAEFEKKKPKNRGRPSKSNNVAGEEWDENENFEVNKILDVYFKRNGQREFLVSWVGYSTAQNSWEPEENMNCKDLIAKFMDKVERARLVDTRELRVHRTPTDRLTLMSDAYRRRLSKRFKQRVHYYDADE